MYLLISNISSFREEVVAETPETTTEPVKAKTVEEVKAKKAEADGEVGLSKNNLWLYYHYSNTYS